MFSQASHEVDSAPKSQLIAPSTPSPKVFSLFHSLSSLAAVIGHCCYCYSKYSYLSFEDNIDCLIFSMGLQHVPLLKKASLSQHPCMSFAVAVGKQFREASQLERSSPLQQPWTSSFSLWPWQRITAKGSFTVERKVLIIKTALHILHFGCCTAQ